MKSPLKTLFASLFAKRNLFNLLLLLIFIGLTIAGAWLIYHDDYQRLYPQEMPVIVATGVAFAISVLMALLMARLPIKNLQNALTALQQQQQQQQEAVALLADEINALKQNDLSLSVTVTDSITSGVADTLNNGILRLRRQWREASESLAELQSTTLETQATAMHLEDATEHQAQQISETTAAAGTVVSDLSALADNVQRHAEFNATIQTALQDARDAAGTLGTQFNALTETQNEMQAGLGTMSSQLQSTDSQLNEVHELNEQTHILSLNAAIQAAMAGEQGHGVAVIAEQIQQLTQRSDSLLNALGTQFATLTENREAISDTADNSSQQLDAGREQLLTTQHALTEIETQCAAFTELVTTIEQEIAQQQAAVQRLSESIFIIDEISQQTTSGSQDNRSSIERIQTLTEKLSETLGQVRLS